MSEENMVLEIMTGEDNADGKIILRLDRVMADRKMSLNELSEKVGVSNVDLSKIKTGKVCIRIYKILAPKSPRVCVLKANSQGRLG